MSILQKSSTNGLKKNIFGEKSPNVFFNSNIKSTNLPNFYFTNYLDNKRVPMVNCLKKEKRRILNKTLNYDNEYEIKTINTNREQLKIDTILKSTIGISNIPVSRILRLKSVYNPDLQFFFLDDKKGNYEVIFIDIYHLVLPAPNKLYKEKKANPKKKYEEHKNAAYCLSNIYK